MAKILLLFFATLASTLSTVFRGQFAFKKPAFTTVVTTQSSGSQNLMISSFGVSLFGAGHDGVYYVDDIANSLKRTSFQVQKVPEPVIWPNEISRIGDELFVPGGFLVPGKRGHISSMKVGEAFGKNASHWKKWITNDEGFFHRVKRIKLMPTRGSDDGTRLVSCRGRKGIFDNGGGEMIYFDNVSSVAPSTQTLFDGCDCFFDEIDLNSDGVPEFIVPSFFGKKLLLVWTSDENGDYSNVDKIMTREIDPDIGAAFDVQVADLNGDGIPDFLATNHQGRGDKIPQSLIRYVTELPVDPTDQHIFLAKEDSINAFMQSVQFKKEVLSTDFPVLNWNFNAAAPGGAQVVYAKSSHEKHAIPPHIVVSGDDSEKAFLFTLREDGSYKQTVIHDCKGTVGGIHVADLDADGWNEIIIPCYAKDYVVIYSFAE